MSATPEQTPEEESEVLHGLPSEVIFCKKCVMNNQRPAATPEFGKSKSSDLKYAAFGEDGICHACHYHEFKKTIDWDERKQWLVEVCNEHRSKDGSWDVLVPGSGGKDSIFVSHYLKTEMGMNPLTVTWAPNAYTDVGWHNMQAWQRTGVDNILVTPDPVAHAKVTRHAFVNLCNPFQPFIMGQKALAPKIALKFGIKFIMYGENSGERHSTYEEALKATMDVAHYTRPSADSPVFLGGIERAELAENHDLSLADTHIYVPALQSEIEEANIQVHHMTTYYPFSTQRNFYYAREVSDFQSNPHGRSEGTFSKYASLDDKIDGFHYFTMFTKFGQGRAVDDACRDIRDGYLSREEAVALVRRYDGEFPKRHFEFFLDYLKISEDEFWDVIERNRSPHLWQKDANGWSLRHTCS